MKNKIIAVILSVMTILSISVPVFADDETLTIGKDQMTIDEANVIGFSILDNTLEVDRDDKFDNVVGDSNVDLIIPSKIGDTNITTIEDSDFANCNLVNITIPNSITTIDDNAFANNHNLTSITIPDSVTSIGDSAFKNCGLTSITIPDSVINIGEAAFNGNNLPDNQAIIYMRNSDGTENKKEIVSYGGINKDITIPNSVTSIGDFVFENCGLTSITIPDSISSIGDYAFFNNNLTNITIPDSVVSIGGYAFGNNNFADVTIPNSVINIGINAFCQDSAEDITLIGDKEQIKPQTQYNTNSNWITNSKIVNDILVDLKSNNRLHGNIVYNTNDNSGEGKSIGVYIESNTDNIIDVTVPLTVTLKQDSQHYNTYNDTLTIQNNSVAQIAIKNAEINSDDFKIVDYKDNANDIFRYKKIDTKDVSALINFKGNNTITSQTKDGQLNFDDDLLINDTADINITAFLPAQRTANQKIFDLTLTFDFA